MLCEDKVVLVTGAASGIGCAAAILFAREGAKVGLVDRDAAGLVVAADRIAQAGGLALCIEADLLSESDIAAAVRATVDEFGCLDAAFNNAGTPGDSSTAISCTDDEWERVIGLNMRAVWLCMKYEITEMLKRGRGAIVNCASLAGERASPSMFSYVASKHGVVGMTRSAAVDFAARGIRVNAIMPGRTDTPMLRSALEAKEKVLPGSAQNPGAGIPMGRLALPEDQAHMAVWLCSDRAHYVTGAAMPIDGGVSALV